MSGIEIIKHFEQCRLCAYPDPATKKEPWTIGWGSTVGADGLPVKQGDCITKEIADSLLARDYNNIKEEIDCDKNINFLPTGCKDAIISLCYNIKGGYSSFKNSRCYCGIIERNIEKIFRNWDWGIAQQGVALGLARRRAKELDLFLTSWR